jgi:hypothetical protein
MKRLDDPAGHNRILLRVAEEDTPQMPSLGASGKGTVQWPAKQAPSGEVVGNRPR